MSDYARRLERLERAGARQAAPLRIVVFESRPGSVDATAALSAGARFGRNDDERDETFRARVETALGPGGTVWVPIKDDLPA